MSNPSVYVETTIPSFYHEVRTEPEMVARRAWTREWWDDRRSHYKIFTSDAVIDELERGDHPVKEEALALVEDVDLLPITSEIGEIVETYIEHRVMPNDPVGDPLHLALASHHKLTSSSRGTVRIWRMRTSFPTSGVSTQDLGSSSRHSLRPSNCSERNHRND